MSAYTVYDENTFEVMYVCSVDVCGEAPSNSTPLMVTENWCRPTFNPETNTFYNNATQEEQAAYLASQIATVVPEINPEDMISFNDVLEVSQTDEQLNELYPNQQPTFRLICTKIEFPNMPGSQTEYIKYNDGTWGKSFILKNN